MNKTFLNKQTQIPWPQIPNKDPEQPEKCSSGGNHWASKPESIPGAPQQSGFTGSTNETATGAQGLHFGVSAQKFLSLSTAQCAG